MYGLQEAQMGMGSSLLTRAEPEPTREQADNKGKEKKKMLLRSVFPPLPRPPSQIPSALSRRRALLLSLFSTSSSASASMAAAPKVLHELLEHGDVRVDNYYWLRDDSRSDPQVLHHLRAENAYTAAVMSGELPSCIACTDTQHLLLCLLSLQTSSNSRMKFMLKLERESRKMISMHLFVKATTTTIKGH
jgi:hypothetical protein